MNDSPLARSVPPPPATRPRSSGRGNSGFYFMGSLFWVVLCVRGCAIGISILIYIFVFVFSQKRDTQFSLGRWGWEML